MALSERERWIHYFSVITTFGMLEDLPKEHIIRLAKEIKNERCRSLSDKDMMDIIKEMGDEQHAGKIAMDEILHRDVRKMSSTPKDNDFDFFSFRGGGMK